MRHQKTWMNSSAWGPHGRSLYGAHQWNAWHYGVGQTLKHQQWVDWPAGSSKLKRISLPPQPYRSASWLRRDYPNSSSYSKTAYLFPCPYQPPSQLLRGSSSLLKAKGTVGASVCLLVVFSVWPQGGHEEVGWWIHLESGSWVLWIVRRNSGQKGSIQENYHSSCCWAIPQTVERRILLLTQVRDLWFAVVRIR